MGYLPPCPRVDHTDGPWSRYRMPWSGTQLQARAPVEVRVEHQGLRTATLATGTLVEAVGKAFDQMLAWGIDMFYVRSGPLEGECVVERVGIDRELPSSFDPVEEPGRTDRA